jgi:hypothetical protein
MSPQGESREMQSVRYVTPGFAALIPGYPGYASFFRIFSSASKRLR